MAARIDREDLRSLVRQALKDALGDAAASGGKSAPATGLAAELRAALKAGKPARVPVALRSGADLDRFARELIQASIHADLRAAILAGDVGFDLGGAADRPARAEPAARTAKPVTRGGVFQMNSGVLSETKIVEIARAHTKIILGSDVVMTPLARDKAREMKVELVRQKP